MNANTHILPILGCLLLGLSAGGPGELRSQDFASKWDRVSGLGRTMNHGKGETAAEVARRLRIKDEILEILYAEESGYPRFYVDRDARGSEDGSSWENAFTSIQPAVDRAAENEGWVWVAEGTYHSCYWGLDRGEYLKLGAVRILPRVMLFGGFSGEESSLSERDPDANRTVIQGLNGPDGYRGVFMDHETLIDGFTVQNSGFRDFAGFTNTGDFNAGGGLKTGDWFAVVRNNHFRNNYAKGGGGLAVWNRENAYTVPGYSPIIENNRFYWNEAICGAGVQIRNSEALFSNNVVAFNTFELEYKKKGIEIVIEPGVSNPPVVVNNISWGNALGDTDFSDFYNHVDMVAMYADSARAYSWNNCLQKYKTADHHQNLCRGDPLFTDPENGDFSPSAASPCIDAGLPEGPPDPDGSRADIGLLPEDTGATVPSFASKWDRVIPLAGEMLQHRGNTAGGVAERLHLKEEIVHILLSEEPDYPVYYVNQNASGSGDGSSWENAFTTIQPAIDCATRNEGWVWVAQGEYLSEYWDWDSHTYIRVGAIRVKSRVVLLGGFSGEERSISERNPGKYVTVVKGRKGPDGYRAVFMDHLSMIDGFTIRRSGYHEYDFNTMLGDLVAGGGIKTGDWLSIIRNNRIEQNYAKNGGGIGVWNREGGSEVAGFAPIVDGNLIYENYGHCGAGVNINNSEALVCHNVITRNRYENADKIKGIEVEIDPGFGFPPLVVNNIVYGHHYDIYNHFDRVQLYGSDAEAVCWHNCIGILRGCRSHEGIILGDPGFRDAENGDFSLTHDSPCLDAGLPEGPPDPDGSRAEIGIYQPRHSLVILDETGGGASGAGRYFPGELVTITADSIFIDAAGATRHLFRGWTGQGEGAYTGPARTATVRMDGNIVQTVEWEKQHRLSTACEPPGGGTVLPVIPPGEWRTDGSSVHLTAVADADSHYFFVSWQGDTLSPDNPLTVRLRRPRSLTAVFRRQINQPPFITPIPDQEILEDGELRLNLAPYIGDPTDSLDQISIEARCLEALSLRLDTLHPELTLNPLPDWSGDCEVFLEVFDPWLLSARDTFLVHVLPVNDPPAAFSLLEPPDGTAIRANSSPVSFRWSRAADVEGDEILYDFYLGPDSTFVGNSGPAVIGLEDTTLQKTWTEEITQNQYWRVVARDGNGGSTESLTFVLLPGTGVAPDENAPGTFTVSQNFPNPFNPDTRIEYRLPRKGHVLLRVFDSRGSLVSVLVDEEQRIGSHRCLWRATDADGNLLPSGQYYLEARFGGRTVHKKISLIK